MKRKDPPEKGRHGGPRVQWIDEITELKDHEEALWVLAGDAVEAAQHKTETGTKIFVRYVGEE